jgi:hypothetical protein
MTTSLSSQPKNQFFTYFEGSEGGQMTRTLHDINKGDYFELGSKKKKIQNFLIPFTLNQAIKFV